MRILIPVIFLLLTGWFALGPRSVAVPFPERPGLPAGVLDGTPLRELPDDPALLSIGGQPLHCNDCHRLFTSRTVTQERLAQHTEVLLRHGLNDRCLNCHAHADREKLELHDGTLVGLDDAPLLCAKCHGPTWRDWQDGIHGRTSGYWDHTRGTPHRLGCTECHDPHSPAFAGIAPLPGPWTLRMGDPAEQVDGHEAEASPLRRWSDVMERVGASPSTTIPGAAGPTEEDPIDG